MASTFQEEENHTSTINNLNENGKQQLTKIMRLTRGENTGAVLVLLTGLFLENCELTDQIIVS